MQVFELHFNPKSKEDKVFDSFVYEPENIYEKRLGGLYMAGELTKVLPHNTNFLNNLSAILKKEYYSAGLKKSCEESLQSALKKANEFSDNETKRGNVGWLGNLNLAILNFKDFVLYFTKVGDIKILLQREDELLDIGQNLEFQDTDPYPLKVFGSIASGKLAQNDKVIVLTKDVFSILSQNKHFLGELSKISDEKGLKEFLKTKKQILSETSGVCLLLMVTEELRPKQAITFRKTPPKFSFKKTFEPVTSLPLKSWAGLKSKTPSFKLPGIKLPKPSAPKLSVPRLPGIHFRLPKVQLPTVHFPAVSFSVIKKKLVLILILILILVAAYFLFGDERKDELQEAQQTIEEVQSKIILAESLLILEDEERATSLFQEAWDSLSSLTKPKYPLQADARILQESIKKYLEE